MSAYGKLSKDQILPIVWRKMGDKVTIFVTQINPRRGVELYKPSVSATENLSSNPARFKHTAFFSIFFHHGIVEHNS